MNNDLISRTALLRNIGTYGVSIDPCNIASLITQKVLAEPVVDAEPVRRGRWEIELDETCDCEFMRCSICSEVFYDGENDTVDITPNYCPNCGAKMDREARDAAD